MPFLLTIWEDKEIYPCISQWKGGGHTLNIQNITKRSNF